MKQGEDIIIRRQKNPRRLLQKIRESLSRTAGCLIGMPSRKWCSNPETDGHPTFNVFEPMLIFPPRTASSVAADSSPIATSIENQEAGQLLWEAVNTALSQLSVGYNDDHPVTAVGVVPSSLPTITTAGLLSPSLESTLRHSRASSPPHALIYPIGRGRPSVVAEIGGRGVRVTHHGDPIPILFPLGWSKQGGPGALLLAGDLAGRKRPGSGSGVNHLNLIQIMGRTAHAWQPYLCQDPYHHYRSSVIRPELKSVELNWILLKREAEDPRKKR